MKYTLKDGLPKPGKYMFINSDKEQCLGEVREFNSKRYWVSWRYKEFQEASYCEDL